MAIKWFADEYQGGAVISSLKKGDKITVARNTYKVTVVFGECIRIQRQDGKSFSIVKYKTIFWGGKALPHRWKFSAAPNFEQLHRDIIGDIVVDMANRNNPLHDFSDSFKRLKESMYGKLVMGF